MNLRLLSEELQKLAGGRKEVEHNRMVNKIFIFIVFIFISLRCHQRRINSPLIAVLITYLAKINTITASRRCHLLSCSCEIDEIFVEVLTIMLELGQAVTRGVKRNKNGFYMDIIFLCT
jgi:hypothetical protein